MSAIALPALQRRRGPTVAGFALLAALATLATAAMLLLHAEAQRIDGARRLLTVAVSDGDAAVQHRRADRVAAMLGQRADLTEVTVRDPQAIAAELGGWLAPGEAAPAMIDARLIVGADEQPLRRALAGQPGIAVVRDGRGFDPLLRLMTELRGIALAILLVALLGAGALGAVATIARLAEQAATIAALRRLGASPAQLHALLRHPVRGETLAGGVGGLAIGLAAMLFIAAQLGNADDGGMTAVRIAPAAWAILAAIPPALVAAALAGAEAAARVVERRRR